MNTSRGPGGSLHQRLDSAEAFLAADHVEHGVAWWSGAARIATTIAGPEVATREVALDHHAMILALEARGTDCSYRVDGHAEKARRLRRGDFTFLPAGHQLASSYVGRTRHLSVVIDRNALQEDVLRAGIRMPTDLRPQVLGRADEVAGGLLAALVQECREPGYADSLYCSYLAHTLLVHLVLRQPGSMPAPIAEPLNRFRVNRLHEYIEENLGRRLALKELAAVIDVGPTHLARLFKSSTSMPLHQYVMVRRLARVRSLLLRSDAPLSEIALQTGFSSQSHLTSVFSRVVGEPPSHFRRRRGLKRD